MDSTHSNSLFAIGLIYANFFIRKNFFTILLRARVKGQVES